MIKLIEIKLSPRTGKYYLQELLLNPDYIVSVEEEKSVSQDMRLNENKRPLDLDPRTSVVEVPLYNGKKHNIIGTPEIVLKKVSGYPRNSRNILKD